MIENYMTVAEAAEYLGYKQTSSIRAIIRCGGFPDAIKFGDNWAIPEESVKNYVKRQRGGAAIKAKKDTARQVELDELNAAIRRAASQENPSGHVKSYNQQRLGRLCEKGNAVNDCNA